MKRKLKAMSMALTACSFIFTSGCNTIDHSQYKFNGISFADAPTSVAPRVFHNDSDERIMEFSPGIFGDLERTILGGYVYIFILVPIVAILNADN